MKLIFNLWSKLKKKFENNILKLGNFFEEINFQITFFKAKQHSNKIRSILKKKCSSGENFTLSKRKLFCILEQGNDINNELTLERKKLFNTSFSDVKRLNWANNKDDKLADFFSENLCWSEGRSFLYEKVKGNYDFYIFIDDDMNIKLKKGEKKENIAEVLKNQLIKHQPIHGSIPNNMWPLKYFNNNFGEVFSMKGGDLCVQIFREDFASIMFPTWKHGSDGSMWYPQFIAHILFPNQSLYLNKLRAINTKHEPHSDKSLESHSNKSAVVKYFAKRIKNNSLRELFEKWIKYSRSELIIYKKDTFKKRVNINFLNQLIN